MVSTWLNTQRPTLHWALCTCPELGRTATQAGALALLPLLQPEYSLQGAGERAAIETALRQVPSEAPLRMLPPWVFLPEGPADTASLLAPEQLLQMLGELLSWLHASGFKRVALYAPSRSAHTLACVAALQTHDKLGMDAYVIGASKQGDESVSLSSILGELLGCKTTPLASPALDQRKVQPAFAKGHTALLPLSAIEQHGAHLPVCVDAFLCETWCEHLLGRAPEPAQLRLLPHLLYGCSDEHRGFAGTLGLSCSSLLLLLRASIARAVLEGAGRIRVLNTHGGNRHLLDLACREAQARGIDCRPLRCAFQPQLDPLEQQWGFHADEWETSLMLAQAPHLVHMEKATCEYPPEQLTAGLIRPEKAVATKAWLTSELSQSGVIGNPLRASAEKGSAWFAAEAAGLAQDLFAVKEDSELQQKASRSELNS